MKIGKWIISAVMTFLIVIVLLITSVELAVYADYGYFRKEYQKYQVGEEVGVEIDDLMDVTEQMMAYLKGNRKNLIIYTTIDGKGKMEFFNDTEKAHMKDVRDLFVGAIRLRYLMLALILAGGFFLYKKKQDIRRIMARSIEIGVVVTAFIAGILVCLISLDFSEAFVKFHEIFFTNELWLLDANTDRLVNIVPEGFFVDTAIRIGVIFGSILLAILVLAVAYDIYAGKAKRKKAANHDNIQ